MLYVILSAIGGLCFVERPFEDIMDNNQKKETSHIVLVIWDILF